MCYGYGLREAELNESSMQFVALFLKGNVDRDNEIVKLNWEQARFIASTMSKEAAKIRFPWEIKERQKLDLSHIDWDKFTPNETDTKASPEQIKQVFKLN